jgi:hypothetical protein
LPGEAQNKGNCINNSLYQKLFFVLLFVDATISLFALLDFSMLRRDITARTPL